ncbi:MAG: Uma2 family endonuclease, partial [Synechocystis sp.]|nr:Uma2 family endonuclease [Synechocystis sp.]
KARVSFMTVTPLPANQIRLISTAEYHHMAEVGILGADEQVELITGQIVHKMPKGPVHSALCKRIEKLLERRLADNVLVRLQDPVGLNLYSEPEPDLAVVRPSHNFYADRHPTPEDVYLIIEIADTSVERDLGSKANLYASAGIADYWVLNIALQQLHVFRSPQGNSYQSQLILKGAQGVTPLAFPDCFISVLECFGTE